MNIIQTGLLAKDAKITIIISRFNYFINEQLLEGTLDILKRIGHVENNNITIIKIPGTLELPLITQKIASLKKNDAIITIGSVIQGETIHFKSIINTVYNLLPKISLENNIPIIIGVLATNNIKQAIERSGGKKGNKGCEIAYVTLEMLNLIKIIK
ncbi:6,7-dimethyl-8-ribityllumazine synthase [Buchnera aphidicola (Nipponaphis monzeni)]|uniref:6,7-dimethyl-8-ribityllumazine synthase n=1 Tax=Buchnera aphidicola (Nipponaphis monzeni) TaxID=2495405 RepID=A0A455TAH5_9GAMM|nr:6,7-dimethyl-8-ribityllumazine synthase [Buchnera aphidicola]BBI01351.1 6,7-dimethyl-8-ribityllumazine synthase [Buchnera aphidicola (Nipponaphis monzeni)]